MTHSKPHSGAKTSVDPTTASSGNSITDKSEDDIDLLRHITQKFEFVEKKLITNSCKSSKNPTRFNWVIFTKYKLTSDIEENLTPRNMENLEPKKVWSKM